VKILDIENPTPDLVDLEARGRLGEINRVYRAMREAHQNEYRTFWYLPNTNLRPAEEINAVLAQMDQLTPTGSAQYFARAWSLVQFLISSEFNSALSDNEKLAPADYLPPLELIDTPEGGKRVAS
jgi:hypothetical protein